MAQKNKYLDEPVWVCERRFTWDTPSQCLKTWRIYPNLLEAVRQEGYQRHLALRDVFRTEIDYWLGGYEKNRAFYCPAVSGLGQSPVERRARSPTGPLQPLHGL